MNQIVSTKLNTHKRDRNGVFIPLPPTPPGMRVRTGRLPRVTDRSRTRQPKGTTLINFENPTSITAPKNSYVNRSAHTEDRA